MAKKPSLTAALAKPADEAPAATARPEPEGQGQRARADRAGKTVIAGHFPEPVKIQLQELALELYRRRGRKVTTQDMLNEALNDLFKKYGKAEICPAGEGA